MGDFLHVYIAISTCYIETDKVLYVVIKNIDFQQFHLNGKEMIMLLICVKEFTLSTAGIHISVEFFINQDECVLLDDIP